MLAGSTRNADRAEFAEDKGFSYMVKTYAGEAQLTKALEAGDKRRKRTSHRQHRTSAPNFICRGQEEGFQCRNEWICVKAGGYETAV